MGCSPFKKNCSFYDSTQRPVRETIIINNSIEPDNIQPAAPNPINFTLLSVYQVGKNIVVKINYPDCTNYEGNKICVYRNTKKKEFIQRTNIDPHFSKTLDSPFARFQPTDDGWKAAIELAKII